MSSTESKSNKPSYHAVAPVLAPATELTGVQSGRVVAIAPDGDILVQVDGAGDQLTACDFLQASSSDCPVFAVGDEVLVHVGPPGGRGCVLGAKKRYDPTASSDQPVVSDTELPEHVVVEAGKSLSLRCGETTIKITKEGKILIKGVDILARAKRTHRIKGGTVAIN
ncbi:hypothetical protein Enr13x_55190 [Stieleria neptunia]|uniref:Phage-related baseplate assembly protein n=1 Tax=Stieleria neptunia TaxID=2527979 RepID=A0A518HXQ1_9BACT|nr:hypothetical protein [Stieleria neptunia]QDV45640.1 hypothetical protein Enr13x_55190 [Stieleria neptunia]